MTSFGWFQIGAFLLVILAITKPLGVFMVRVFNREATILDPVLRPIERLVYRLTGVNERLEMPWTEYTAAMLLFSGVSLLILYGIERMQKWLPWNPEHIGNVAPDLAWNT
ncbi:MAG TPA: potassium-transporting ATPase subunit KdpA, partial [Candidatus Solibacter sp.]|nr:potassium-transporting ATPase subunit KdpA [Candidatus Solibacter sp.]